MIGFRVLPTFITAFLMLPLSAGSAFAQPLPGPADIDRVKPATPDRLPPQSSSPQTGISTGDQSLTEVPPQASDIKITLHHIDFKGVTVFTELELKALYQDSIGKEVPLSTLWIIANKLTMKYRADGYFLSRAYIPAQEAGEGRFTIEVVEGYIGKVRFTGDTDPHHVLNFSAEKLMAMRPIKLADLERELLLLNDIPGIDFQGTLEPYDDDQDEASVMLSLAGVKTKGFGSVSFDNTGSRYLGPYQATASWTFSPVDMQETSVSLATAPFRKELYALNLQHKILMATDYCVDLSAGFTTAYPGYTLAPQDIKSRSFNGSIGLSHQFLRQRESNLTGRVAFDLRNTNSDIIGIPLSRDKTRVLNVDVNYDIGDRWQGYNYFGLNLRQGLDAFGSNDRDDTDISRLDAMPNFTKAQASYRRVQRVAKDWSGTLSLSGQKASGSLYSSEEFGYGGLAFGRAYDTSEIAGDDGVSAAIELHYQGIQPQRNIGLTPYLFYDIGKVWNKNPDQEAHISGSSVGAGVYISHISGLSANFAIAQPLTKSIDAPLYGGNGKNPRYIFQMSHSF